METIATKTRLCEAVRLKVALESSRLVNARESLLAQVFGNASVEFSPSSEADHLAKCRGKIICCGYTKSGNRFSILSFFFNPFISSRCCQGWGQTCSHNQPVCWYWLGGGFERRLSLVSKIRHPVFCQTWHALLRARFDSPSFLFSIVRDWIG